MLAFSPTPQEAEAGYVLQKVKWNNSHNPRSPAVRIQMPLAWQWWLMPLNPTFGRQRQADV